MTATLERRWGEPIAVKLLADDISLEHRALFRFVVLHTQSSAEAVEIAMVLPREELEPPVAGSPRRRTRPAACY